MVRRAERRSTLGGAVRAAGDRACGRGARARGRDRAACVLKQATVTVGGALCEPVSVRPWQGEAPPVCARARPQLERGVRATAAALVQCGAGSQLEASVARKAAPWQRVRRALTVRVSQVVRSIRAGHRWQGAVPCVSKRGHAVPCETTTFHRAAAVGGHRRGVAPLRGKHADTKAGTGMGIWRGRMKAKPWAHQRKDDDGGRAKPGFSTCRQATGLRLDGAGVRPTGTSRLRARCDGARRW